MSQSEKSFTVSDRRHFTTEGRPLDPSSGEEAQPVQPAPSRTDPEAPPADDRPADFSRFLLGLAAEAGRLLAGEGLPEGTPPAQALAGARQLIAILEMLRDKTEGRRTSDEEALFADLLYQLRMAYVERTRAGRA